MAGLTIGAGPGGEDESARLRRDVGLSAAPCIATQLRSELLAHISLRINGREALVPNGITVAAALAISGSAVSRHSITGEPRAPLCGMGICFECRVTIDGRAHCRACQTDVAPGMEVVSE